MRDFPHRGETKKNFFYRILQLVSCHHFGWAFPSSAKSRVRKSSNCIQNAFLRLSPSGRNEKTPFGSNFTISVSCHHFGWAFPISARSRLTKVVQLHSKRVFSTFPIGAKRNFGFMNAVGARPSSTRLLALIGKAHPKWWHETEIVKFDPNGVFSFRPDGESRRNAF